MCSTTFRTETIRVEMDTRTVPDWNELDFITLKGSLALPRGVLPLGTREILYVPDPDAFGEDRFSYTLSDCASEPGRQPLPATVAVAIFAENDSPVAANYTMPDLASQQGDTYHRTRRVDLAEFVVDVDGDELIYSVDQIQGNVTALLENGFLTLEGALQEGFGLRYTATDPSGASAHGFIAFLPGCLNGVIDDNRCSPCRAGTYAAEAQDGRFNCRPCDAGQFQPEAGQYGCLSCDGLGDAYQNLLGQSSCFACAANTQRYIGVLTAANKGACQCKDGTQAPLHARSLAPMVRRKSH
jgi:hypothetical protein